MTFVVTNTLTKAKEPFVPLQPPLVRMYNCGPTVYGRAHIGNLRTYVFADTLRRWLEYRAFEVRQVMNITDVGHMTDDERDQGEDKIEAQARREKRDPFQISRHFTELFLQDVHELGLRPALIYPRASAHVSEMLALIERLIARGHAYEVDGNVYFDVASFPRYGRLSGNVVEALDPGARIEVRAEKRHPADFALWKSDPHHLMKWSSRFGEHGFPGWHIECSAMAMKHLGEELDIHTGGEDNVFPHHECEIAQSECATGKPFARYWIHSKFLLVDGGKMSKRLGNCYSLDDVKAQGFTVRELRYALIRGQYNQPLNFTWEIMRDSHGALENLQQLHDELVRLAGDSAARCSSELAESARAAFEAAMDDDLNTPRALAALFDLRRRVLAGGVAPPDAAAALGFLRRADTVLSLIEIGPQSLAPELEALLRERESARREKRWPDSDRLREELLRRGVIVEDKPEGQVWRRR
jgi:cysteinyl-tRNA synthetase